jgi:hypothetical protein
VTERATWTELLGALIVLKERLDRLDPDQTQPYTVPRVKTSEDEIAEYERDAGERLPEDYRQFLLHANGWPCFYFRADLFGLPELAGRGNWDSAQTNLRSYDEQGVLADVGLPAGDVIPVCAGPLNMGTTLFVLVRSGRPKAGQVVWLDGEEIDRYESFYDYVVAMLDYLRAEVGKLDPETIGPVEAGGQ